MTLDGNGHTISGESVNSSRSVVNLTGVTNVNLSNLSIANGYYCLQMTNSRNCTLEQIDVADGEIGILGSETANTRFRQISVSGITNGSAMSIVGSKNTIQRSSVEGPSGIRFFGSRNKVQNTVGYATYDTLRFYDGDNNIAQDNRFRGAEVDSIYLQNVNDSNITGNEIRSAGEGISLSDSDNNTVARNDISADYGIVLNESDRNTVTRNDLRDSYYDDIINNGYNNQTNANILN